MRDLVDIMAREEAMRVMLDVGLRMKFSDDHEEVVGSANKNLDEGRLTEVEYLDPNYDSPNNEFVSEHSLSASHLRDRKYYLQ